MFLRDVFVRSRFAQTLHFRQLTTKRGEMQRSWSRNGFCGAPVSRFFLGLADGRCHNRDCVWWYLHNLHGSQIVWPEAERRIARTFAIKLDLVAALFLVVSAEDALFTVKLGSPLARKAHDSDALHEWHDARPQSRLVRGPGGEGATDSARAEDVLRPS